MRRFFGGKCGKFSKNVLVRLNEDADHPRLIGAVGVVVEVHGGEYPSYEVEFISALGAVLDRLAIKEAQLSEVDMQRRASPDNEAPPSNRARRGR